MRIHRVAMAVALSVAATIVGWPVAAAPSAAGRCGAVITADTALTSDLVCSGDALTLTGDLVLDLRGHQLTALGGTAVSVVGDGSPTIRNGRITDSRTGFAAAREESEDPLAPRQVTISRVTFAHNTLAVKAGGTGPFFGAPRQTDVTIDRSHFHANDDAVTGVFTGRFTISWSSFTNNRRAVAIDTGAVTVTRSYFGGNHNAFVCVEANPCSLETSRLVGNVSGVTVGSCPLTLTRTTISGSQTAVSVFGASGVLDRNRIDDNTTGVNLVVAFATLTRNTFTRNDTGFTASDLGAGDEATLVRNRFVRNGDGIFTEATDVRLDRNFALHNRRWGIYAPNATDLGGNRARGNGQSPQCLGVVC